MAGSPCLVLLLLVVVGLVSARAPRFRRAEATSSGEQTVRVLTVPLPGLLAEDKSGGDPTGFIPDVLHAIESRTNLKFDYIRPYGTDFGRQLDGGSFNGIVGQLLSGDGDMIAAALENHTSYQKAMALTTPLYLSNVTTVYPAAASAISSALALLGPATANFAKKYLPYTVVLENTATRDYLEQQEMVNEAASIASLIWKNVTASRIQAMIPKNYTAAMNCVKKFLCKFVGRTPAIDESAALLAPLGIVKDPKIIRTVEASFAVRSGRTDGLLEKINSAISALLQSGDIEKLYREHFKHSTFINPKLGKPTSDTTAHLLGEI